MCIVVGDLCLSRRKHGRHRVLPLHSDIIVSCLNIGFDYLSPIIWHKVTNINTEAKRPSYCLGRPGGPNSAVKNEVEYILLFRKPGRYRRMDAARAKLSQLTKQEYVAYYSQVWYLSGDNSNPHPASFPIQIPYRLIKMFSYVGDCILDPFLGSGTTTVAAMMLSRNSVGYEVEPSFATLIERRVRGSINTSLLEARWVGRRSLHFRVKV
jgi:DNA modification methylase